LKNSAGYPLCQTPSGDIPRGKTPSGDIPRPPSTCINTHYCLDSYMITPSKTARGKFAIAEMFALFSSATPSLSLSHAESRVGCEARRSFCAAVSSPSARAFELALLLAAEERPSEDVAAISSEVDVILSALAEKAHSRLQLESLVGGDPKDPKCIAAATSRVLFGSEGAGEDDDEAFFSGSSQADYYDPRNSYLDAVLKRRQGIPITLSLVYAEVQYATLRRASRSLLAIYLILTTYCFNFRCASGSGCRWSG
jgi:hypothetical protein